MTTTNASNPPAASNSGALGHRLIYLMLVFSPVVFMAILFMLQSREKIGTAGIPQSIEALLWLFGLVVPLASIIFLYSFLIPAIKRKRMPTDFGSCILIIATGDVVLGTVAVMIGIIQIQYASIIAWVPILVLIIGGVCHGFYLYLVKVVPMEEQIINQENDQTD
ncbi:MAG TPA: hypothetical protein VKM55_29895 [Candidatus Lokiarchaeia archaeon]|nr:hypothetical protein [Candidatus Lokiarchaeia archaeon]